MPKIKWKGIIKSENDFPKANVPENAKKLDEEENMTKMMIKALPFIIPSILILGICLIIKTSSAGEKIINNTFLFIGVIIGILLIFVHEFLHAIAYPKNSMVYIGIMPKSLAVIAVSSSPINRNRFIFINILPIILGLIPLIIFCLNNSSLGKLNSILFGMSVIGMTSGYIDFYNIYNMLKKVPKNAIIQNNKNETYYFE